VALQTHAAWIADRKLSERLDGAVPEVRFEEVSGTLADLVIPDLGTTLQSAHGPTRIAGRPQDVEVRT
jgi:hypothetical protein